MNYIVQTQTAGESFNIMPIEIQKFKQELDLITPDTERYFVKLIFFKQFRRDLIWHICLPEMTNMNGFLGFCTINCWSEIDTQNVKRLDEMMVDTKTYFCEKCAEEFFIARQELIKQGYLIP